MLLYILKVNLAWLFCYLLYRLCRGRDTFFRLRRTLLLLIPLFSIIYPVLHIQLPLNEPTADAIIAVQQDVWMPTVQVVERAETSNGGIFIALIALYIAGVIALLLYHSVQTLSAMRLILRSPRCAIYGRMEEGLPSAYRRIPSGMAPFSFFGWLCVPEDLIDTPQLVHVLRHEQVHMRQWHSLDVLLLSILRAFCWFNPASWLTLGEIRQIHEYLADDIASRSNARSYQYALLGITPCTAATTVVNNFKLPQPDANTGSCFGRVVMFFNHLPLKKRIVMINKKKTRSVWQSKYLLLASAGLLLVALSQPINAHIEEAVAPVLKDVPDLSDVIGEISGDSAQETGISTIEDNTISEDEAVILPDTTIRSGLEKTISDGKPLIIVDGNFIKVKRLEDLGIDPEEILSLTVLHKEKATALYGSRGKDGVIIIETKNASENHGRKIAITEAIVDTCTTYPIKNISHYPQFPGGEAAMLKFITTHIHYPEQALKLGIQGTVTVAIAVDGEGNITDSWVTNDANQLLKEAALNLVKDFPKFIPAQTDGGKNDVFVKTFPVVFRLN